MKRREKQILTEREREMAEKIENIQKLLQKKKKETEKKRTLKKAVL